MQLNRLVVECLLRVRNDPTLRPFLEHLMLRKTKTVSDCLVQTDVALYRAQGRAQELQDLLDLIEKSPQLFEKVKDQK